MNKVAKYITRGGERWDNIAYLAYGDAFRYGEIILANPNVPKYDVFPQGVTVNVPVSTESESAALNLPPWKRA